VKRVDGNTNKANTTSHTRMIAYSAGGLAFALTSQCFSTYVQFFYIDVLKLAASWVGVAMVVYGIWNAFNDPLAGHISDHTRTRWGRRIPYIAFGTVPLVACFIFVWIPPFQPGQGQALWLFVYFFLIILLFDTLWTFVALNWTALFPEMFPDLRQRARVSGWRQFFAIPGLILGIALAPVIYGSLGWRWMGIIFGLTTGIFLYTSMWGSWERPEFRQDKPLTLWNALRVTFSNRAFRLFLVVNFCIQFAFVMLTATIPFYAKYILGLGDMQTSVMLGATFVAVVPCLYLWTKITQCFGTRRTLLAALVVFAVTLFPLLATNSFLEAIITFIFIGVGLAGLLMLPDLLVADVVDEDELQTGVRREGMYYGMSGFVIRFAVSIQSLLLTQTLNLTGYTPDLPVQPDSVLLGLRLMMSVVPFIALLVAFLDTKAYPLDGSRLAQIKAQVALLHQEKAARNIPR
jgi:GPH family glycoside/pentoside/hexuronide:cation symporter